MRLIDADEVKENIKKSLISVIKVKGNWSLQEINEVIDIAPTIEAIPYSLLKELQDKYGNACTYGHILKCIDDWRKENEDKNI